jgi:hypothetical protein
MNALQIIEQVRAHDAELVLDSDRLVIRGRGARLPDDLHAALREHKAEVMIALGAPLDRTVAGILAELRPTLPESLRGLPDASLLAMVNWTIIHAWEKTIRQAHLKHEAER